jgi:hypothetical protein
MQKSKSPYDMVVVKPTAFGKVIPSQITLETARLVAQVANISSEDWARLYEFHHVIWPDEHPEGDSDVFTTMDSLSRAVTHDAVVEHQSSVLISIGQAPTCVDPTLDNECLLAKVIKYCRMAIKSEAVATISMVELSDEKHTFRDLFNPQNKDVFMRHVDMKGAVLEGLTQISFDHLKDAWHEVQNISGQTVVVTINIWDNAVAQELTRSPNSQITLVELTRSPLDACPSKMRSLSSTVSLGQVLRHLSHTFNAAVDAESTVSYRESNVTKVLQRALESSKVVLLAAVSQLSRDYETTLATLNFLRSLLFKPGKTASSPFQHKEVQHKEKDQSLCNVTDQLLAFANDESFLEQIISDPRQRLAKVFKQSPSISKKDLGAIETAASEEYSPVDYMKGLDIDNEAGASPVVLADTKEIPSITPPQKNEVLDDIPSHGHELRVMLSEEIVSSAGIDSPSLDVVTDVKSFSSNENSLVSNKESLIHFTDELLRSEQQLCAESSANKPSLDFNSNWTRSLSECQSVAPCNRLTGHKTSDSCIKNVTSSMFDESYSGDIIVLEDAVHKIQSMQSGLWKSR